MSQRVPQTPASQQSKNLVRRLLGQRPWKRLWGLAGSAVLLGIVAFLAVKRSGSTCGALFFGRWSLPVLVAAGVGVCLAAAALLIALIASEERLKSLGRGLALAAFSTLLTLIVLDLALRLTDPPRVTPSSFAENHPILGYFFVPNNRFTFTIWEVKGQNVFHTDENGLIVRGHSNAPQSDATRIMVLGDSIVSGLQVKAEANFTVLLEDLLNSRGAGAYQTINLGVDGYSPIRYYLAYQVFKERFDPDIVIVVLYLGNDFSDTKNLIQGDQVTFDRSGLPVRVAPALDEEKDLVWLNPSVGAVPREEARPYIVEPEYWHAGLVPTLRHVLTNAICVPLQVAASEIPPPTDDRLETECYDADGTPSEDCAGNVGAIYKEVYSDEDIRNFGYTLDTLRDLQQAVEADGARMILVIMPESNQIPGQGEGIKVYRGMRVGEVIESRAPQAMMAGFCSDNGIECLDLLEPLTAHQDEPIFWVYDLHLTPRGHQVVADVLADYLEQPAP
jgi:hypothetical protein